LVEPDTAFMEKIKEGSGEMTDRLLLNMVEHQVSRVETCINTLELRNMVRPFVKGLAGTACPISDIFGELAAQLTELRTMKMTLAGGAGGLGIAAALAGASAIQPRGMSPVSVVDEHGHDTEHGDDGDSLSVATITPRATPIPSSTPVPPISNFISLNH